jgi:BA14K-like protein
MKLMNQIELAPKNGDFVVLQDARTGSWEVGRWAQETSSWVQIDGKPLRLFPTHWVPVSDDPAGSRNRQSLSFLVPSPPLKVTAPKRPRTRFILAFTAAVIFISGYAVFDFGFIGTGPVKDSSLNKIIGSATELEQDRERDRADVLVRNLAAAREEIALRIERENAAQAKALEVKRIADAKQKELKQALDEKTARADTLAKDLATEIAVNIGRVNAAQAEALQAKLVAEAKQKELKQALDEKAARAETLARELASVRENIASAGKPLNVDVVAQDGASPTGPLNRPSQESNAAPAITGAVPNTPSPDDVTTETPTFSNTRSAPLSAAPNDVVGGLSRPPTRPSQSQPTSATAVTPNSATTDNADALVAQTPSQPKCDVSACTSAYRSFRKSDCTYQPSGGPRRLCTNGVVPGEPSGAPDAAATSNSHANANLQSNARCNVNACAAAYGSFNQSDCTFQPYHPLGGPRRLCAK